MGVLAPTEEEKKEVINKVKEELLIEGEDKFEREDLEDLETDEKNLRRFWIHALHLGGDRIEDTVSLIVKTLLWRKEFGVKDICKEKISKEAFRAVFLLKMSFHTCALNIYPSNCNSCI